MISRLAAVSTLVIALLFGAYAEAAVHRAHSTRHRAHRRVCQKTKHHKRKRRCRRSRRVRADAASASRLAQLAANAYSAQVAWPPVSGARSARILLNGQMIDQVGSGSGTYTVANLWPSSSFRVTVELDNSAGVSVGRFSRTVSTGAASGAFPRLYAPESFINAPIPAAPRLAPNSGAMVSKAITAYASHANLSNSEAWGIPIVSADRQSNLYSVACLKYGCTTHVGRMRIPTFAQPDTGSDGHLVVLQPDGNELDMWIGQHTQSGWSAGSRSVQSVGGSALGCSRTNGCSAANAAGFALAAGVIRPEEIAQGHIDHALAITTPYTRHGYIACPASNSDGTQHDGNALPMGAHVQLDPSINVSSLAIPGWQKVIAVALQQYGAYVVDTGGSLALSGESGAGRGYNAWARAGVPGDGPSLGGLPWKSMRVLAMSSCGA